MGEDDAFAPCTPEKSNSGSSRVGSPLSKASTPERGAPRYLEGELDSQECGRKKLQMEDEVGHVSHSTDDVSPGSSSRNGKKLRLSRKRHKQFFGQYDEEDPDPFLLMQDLISWHKRGVDQVSVTVFSDDAPFDVSPMVHDGSADLDIETIQPDSVEYDEDCPDAWLLAQDLTALSRRGASRVSITVLPNADPEEGSGEQQKDAFNEAAATIDADALGPMPYREDDPELWLLQQDLLALHRRGAEMVSVTVLTDDKPADIRDLVWPCGSGHIDLRSHYRHAAPYPQEDECEDSDECDAALEDFLLVQDLIAVQDAGADVVSVTCISHDAEEDLSLLQRQGWEISHPLETPSSVLLLT